ADQRRDGGAGHEDHVVQVRDEVGDDRIQRADQRGRGGRGEQRQHDAQRRRAGGTAVVQLAGVAQRSHGVPLAPDVRQSSDAPTGALTSRSNSVRCLAPVIFTSSRSPFMDASPSKTTTWSPRVRPTTWTVWTAVAVATPL